MDRRRIRENRRRRRNQTVLTGITGAMAVAVLAAGILLWQRRDATAETKESAVWEETTQPPATEAETLDAAVTVRGIDLTGLTRSEAEEALKKTNSGPLKIRAGEEIMELVNPADEEISRILDQVYLHPEGGQELDFDEDRILRSLKEQAASAAERWNRSPVDSTLVSFNKESGAYEYSKEQDGRTLEQDQLVDALLLKIRSADYEEPVDAVFSAVAASRNQAQAKALYQVIGSYTTKLTDNKNRNQNVKLAAAALDGRILQPGEAFSFNETTGNRTSEKGYQPAGAYRNGVLIEEPGGGVCQVSTTLYHSVIQSDFPTLERNSHSYAPSYVSGGQDAMVSYDGYAGPDLKFRNTSSDPVVIRASVQGLELKISIVGIPVVEDGVKVSIRSEKLRDVEPPAPVYEEDSSLPYGTEKVVEQAKKGSVWKSYRVYTLNGEVVKEVPLHNTTYKAKAAQIRRNTTVMTGTEQENPEVEDQTVTAPPQETAGQTESESEVETTVSQDTSEAAGSQGPGIPQSDSTSPDATDAQIPIIPMNLEN